MAKRESKKLIQEVTLESCEDAFAQYNRCVSDLQVIEGKMNAEITAIKEKYESRINKLQEVKDENFEVMQAWAENNPDQFESKKSIDFTHGTIGFRTGMPKLSLRKGYTWSSVLDIVKDKVKNFVRTKEEVDKDGLLAARETTDLKSLGLEVKQDETFYVQPALEVVSN